MFWTSCPNVLILTALILCIDFVNTALAACSITETYGQYYSTKASNLYGNLLKTLESKNKSECRQNCCELERCNFMMYSTVLKDQEGSSNITCFLFNCTEISKCKTKPLSRNITGISVIGIKQENITEASFGDGSSDNSSSIEQHKIYKPLLNSTIHSSESQSSVNTVTINTDKPKTNKLNFNTTNNSDAFGIHKATKLLPKEMHSLITYVASNPVTSISNNSYPTLSMSNLVTSISNNSYPTLSMIIPSQSDAHTSEIVTMSDHSFSIPSYPLKSIHNSNHSTLSTLMHSTHSLHMHTLGNWLRSNDSLSSHVGWLSGSHSKANDGAHSSRYQSHSLDKISHTLSSMSVSADTLVNSLRSNPDSEVVTPSPSSTFVPSQYSTEAVLLSTIPSLSQLHPSRSNLQASKSTSHTSKGGHKTRRKFSEQESHTTPVSLVISLIIGILFFGTVVFLIGRRWSEHCFRRGYSRVDYLLNDYD